MSVVTNRTYHGTSYQHTIDTVLQSADEHEDVADVHTDEKHVNGLSSPIHDVIEDARNLIDRMHYSYHTKYGLSTTSCQVYDTAWVSLIIKGEGSSKRWLFPESFYYVLQQQSHDGSWGCGLANKTVGVIDTCAGLLALLRHAMSPFQIRDVSRRELQQRIQRATAALDRLLNSWDDLETTNHIAVELIVPAMLDFLRDLDSSLIFKFDIHSTLLRLRDVKLAQFELTKLYSQKPCSMLHSLEAFIGRIDFDQVRHHLHNGSMMASPSATAAYLMHASRWDDEAESYLQHVAKHGSGHGNGGIPGTFPTAYFEFSWVICTLIRSGFTVQVLNGPSLESVLNILLQGFEDDRGLLGFAPRAIDVDDTAKALLTLHLNGQFSVDAQMMVKVFESEHHFSTFGAERDPSLSSNCHVLMALLHQQDPAAYTKQISKAANFICEFWWKADGMCKDKWHLSYIYPTMLMVESFVDLMQAIDQGQLKLVGNVELLHRIRICSGQAIVQLLLGQSSDGSWDGLPEQTAYAVLTLAQVQHICSLQGLVPTVQTAISNALRFLDCSREHRAEFSWTSKTCYSVAFVAEAYRLAAFKAGNLFAHSDTSATSSSAQTDVPNLKRYATLIHATPLFEAMPDWQLTASLVESALFVPLLRLHKADIFERNSSRIETDDYIDLIPFTWVGCNNRARTNASTAWLYDMMLLSMFGFQVDEYMEGEVAAAYEDDLSQVHKLLDAVLQNNASELSDKTIHRDMSGTDDSLVAFPAPMSTPDCSSDSIDVQGQDSTNTLAHLKLKKQLQTNDATRSSAILKSLTKFVQYVANHSIASLANVWDQQNLRRELYNFLHAHATQLEDNYLFARQQCKTAQGFLSPRSSYFSWVRGQAADHVACAYSFAFACCLLSTSLCSGEALFDTAREKYLAAACARHLTTMCRMYNDVGSIARDSRERNVNSIHFPEFSMLHQQELKKKALISLAEYEHTQLNNTLVHLEAAMAHNTRDKLSSHTITQAFASIQLFCDVTVLYDQLYVVRDLSSSFTK